MVKVTVSGIITSIEEKTKDDKMFTDILLAQKGEKVQVAVRVPGHAEKDYSLFEIATFEGRLLAWKTRDGVGMMVSVEEND